MSDANKIVTRVWISEGCIACNACEEACPEVFQVTGDNCLIREAAMNADFIRPLSEAIIAAAEGCPTEVIKYDLADAAAGAPAPAAPSPTAEAPAKAAEPKAPAAEKPVPVAAKAAAAGKPAAKAPAKAAPVAKEEAEEKAPPPPPRPKIERKEPGELTDPLLQAISDKAMLPAGRENGQGPVRAAEARHTRQLLSAIEIPADAPPDMRAALLAVGGAYVPRKTLSQQVRGGVTRMLSNLFTRRKVNLALAIGWGSLLFCGVSGMAMVQDFLAPKASREPKKIWRIGRLDEFAAAGGVYEQYKRTPSGEPGFWIVNLSPEQDRIVAISTICTHLGCIPDWLKGDLKFKCPCHGSGFFVTGVNFEGPAPRPLERFRIFRDTNGYLVVDMTRVYRQELGQWDDPNSYVSLV